MKMLSRMVRIGRTMLILCLPGSALLGQQTLELDTGDQLTGRLTQISEGVWVFRFLGGEAKVPADKVTGFTAAEAIGVRLADGTIAAVSVLSDEAGQLALVMGDGIVRRVAPAEIEAVGDATDLAALTPMRIGIFSPIDKFWGASGSAGFSSKSGNSRALGVLANVDLERRTVKDRFAVSAGLNVEQSLGSGGNLTSAVAKYYGALRADVYLRSRVFVFAGTRQERDTFQDIALRSNYHGGLGIQLRATQLTDLRFSVSGGTRIEHFVASGSARATVLNAGSDIRLRLGLATFEWKLGWVANVEDLADYQLRSEMRLTTTVYEGLGFRVGLLNEHDNQPSPGIEKHDMLLTTTLAYSIGLNK